MSLTTHWKLDDNAANTTITATVGSNATLLGGDNTSVKHSTDAPGNLITSSFAFNGIDDFFATGFSTFISGAAFSFGAWVKFNSSSGCIWGTNVANGSRIEKTSDTVIRYENNNLGSANFTVPSLGTSAWHFILVTRTTGNSVRVFVDGVESSTGAQTVGNGFAPGAVARRDSTTFFDGKLAWLKVFNSDESANVATLYAEGVSAGGGSALAANYYYRS